MRPCYWEINPRMFFFNNPISKKIIENNKGNIPDNIIELFVFYEECASECLDLQKGISSVNFKETMIKLFDIEAKMSEIAFYLEKVDLTLEENLPKLITQEYLLDYYENISSFHDEGYLLVSCLKDKVQAQQRSKFGIKGKEEKMIDYFSGY